ncbi:hypothetical protein KRP22_005358 [Phytophthora ramorum]|uniref:Serine/threonine-protein kinase 11-interacting protein n=1 Tax=Phytophthora ramorum TaxID=164328 RepID=UPI0030AB0F90|nr:Serine/threonine-protein kinase 11-interacting protein [Phytophthora ramorum]KAH7508427.1 Serine/threonine-protein kinase 11-interacting protein [Phytophthora ramorum]
MDRLEVRALPLGVARGPAAAPQAPGIALDEALSEEAFLKELEEMLQQHAATLGRQFLVLSARQVDLLAFRLHDALAPKRDADTRVVQAWTIQPQLQLKVKASAHLQVLKLSTILREVQRLRLHQSQEENEAPRPVEVEIFPSLKVIEALNTDVRALHNVHCFAGQLRELHIEHTQVTTLKQLLTPHHGQEKPWRKLRKLQMNCCGLEVLDTSVNLLTVVRTLDLGWNNVEKVETSMATSSLEVLSLCHNRLRDVPPIQALRGLRELDLAVNRIASLKGLETLSALERLDVSHNLIDDVTETELLSRLPRLAYLKMEFNPISRRPDYRREVLFYLGEPIELDGQPWNDAELSSMKNRRMLLMLDGAKIASDSSIWGQSVEPPVYPRVRVQSGIVVKNPKLVLGYPSLPRSQSFAAQYAEIQNPPSTLPTKSKHSNDDGWGSGQGTENGAIAANALNGNSQGPRGGQTSWRSVDDYFRTQRDLIVTKEKKESESQATISEQEDNDDSTSEKPTRRRNRTRSRKYTASDFMRDFEEEELLVREGNDIYNVDVRAARSTSQTQISSPQQPGRSISARVLLSAKEAAEHDLHFGIDGVPANVEIKSRELIERFIVSDGKRPITITRWLPDVVAVGTSIHSNRAKIITMKLQPRGASSVADTAYQIDAVASLENLLPTLVARLYQQYKSRIVICNCASCGALSLLTPKYPKRIEADDAVMVYSCLLCSSCNVREISFKKLAAICANQGIAIPSAIPLAPPPWETISEGFYIEEPAATDASIRECIMISCNGIREVAAPTVGGTDTREVHSDEWSDAIVHAMTTTLRLELE